MAAILVCGGNKESRRRKIREIYGRYKKSEAENDPDTITLANPEKGGMEEIRQLKHWLALKPFSLPPKMVLLLEIQNLSNEAQASLGKILEEPPGETIFLLSCPQEELVLPTIVSRCQLTNLPSESEINFSVEEIKKYENELETLLKARVGERVKFCEQFKNREEAENFCQRQLFLWRKRLLLEPTQENKEIVREVQKTLKYLSANVNARLAVENLLLNLPLKAN